MSSLITNATIQIRKDTAGNWTSNNPTPAAGEWCLETDTKYIKIGDGSTAWTSLNYKIRNMTVTTYTTNGAIALTDKLALLNGNGATAQMTLAIGTAGQEIIIIAIDTSNACDVDPATFANGTTITFTPAYEWARLISDGTNWYMIGGTGAVT